MELTLTLILLLGLIVLIAQGLEGITGFGSTVLAVPFLAMILGLEKAVAVSAAHTWLLTIYIVFVSWDKIVWKEFRFIALYVVIGLPVGYFLFKTLDDLYLRILLSMFMIGVGFHGLRMTRRNRRLTIASTAPVKKSRSMRFILFLGGIIHGAFASGGPFVVIYASQALKDKTLFRVSLCLLWLCMNTILLIGYTVDGVWMRDTCLACYALLVTLPFLLVGILVGNRLHYRVSEYVFRLIVFALLLGTGFVVMYGAIGSLRGTQSKMSAFEYMEKHGIRSAYECVAVTRKDGPPRTKAFVEWLISPEGQAVVRETGYCGIE
ncbi:MAG: TSUP family transporter [Planctomycetaceae bacterium]|nr:TSUP family transporter [Planctomycetaceae bacterium]